MKSRAQKRMWPKLKAHIESKETAKQLPTLMPNTFKSLRARASMFIIIHLGRAHA